MENLGVFMNNYPIFNKLTRKFANKNEISKYHISISFTPLESEIRALLMNQQILSETYIFVKATIVESNIATKKDLEHYDLSLIDFVKIKMG